MIELTVEFMPKNPEILLNVRELSHMPGSTGAALSGHSSLSIMENPLNCYLDLECTGSVVVGCRPCAAMHLFLTQLQIFEQAKKSIGNGTMQLFFWMSHSKWELRPLQKVLMFSPECVMSLRRHRQRRSSLSWKLFFQLAIPHGWSATLGWKYWHFWKYGVCNVESKIENIQLAKLSNGLKTATLKTLKWIEDMHK